MDRLATHYRGEKKTVGIIAVDPSSPFTGGAILGDRIRMQGHATDSGIFIRSMATRGYLGGLAQATGDTALLLDAAGKEMILVETVGVGQGEIEIVRLADCTLVVLVPGMGDDVQSLKAGLMEIGDIFVLNKVRSRRRRPFRAAASRDPADRPRARRAGSRRSCAPSPRKIRESTSLPARLRVFREHFDKSQDRHAREIAHWKEWLLRLLQTRLMERVVGEHMTESEFDKLAAEVAERKLDPYAAVNEILARSGLGGKK